MAKYRALYILFLLVMLSLAVLYESRLTFVLLTGTLILPAVSLCLLIVSRLTLKIELTPPKTFTRKNEHFEVTVKVKNRFIIPVSPMLITGVFHDDDGNISSGRKLIVNARPLSCAEFFFGGNIRFRGEYLLGLEYAYIYDLLRIFRFRIKLKPSCRAVVFPRRILLDENSALSRDDNDSVITNLSFTDNSSFSSVREYESGDLLKHIHWKLSAKHDQLMVKQMEQELGSNAVIIADTRAVGRTDEENKQNTDVVLESALAVTAKVISDGRTALNVYRNSSGTVSTDVIEEAGEYEKLLFVYSTLPSDVNELSAVNLSAAVGEVYSENESLFIFAPTMDGDSLRAILAHGAQLCSGIRIYLACREIPGDLTEAAKNAKNISVYTIDPEHIALSLINTMRKDL